MGMNALTQIRRSRCPGDSIRRRRCLKTAVCQQGEIYYLVVSPYPEGRWEDCASSTGAQSTANLRGGLPNDLSEVRRLRIAGAKLSFGDGQWSDTISHDNLYSQASFVQDCTALVMVYPLPEPAARFSIGRI